MKAAITILLLLALGLGAALFFRHKQAVEVVTLKEEKITDLSTKLESTKIKLDDQIKISEILRDEVTKASSSLSTVSNDFSQISATLAKTKADYEASMAAAKKAEADAKRALAEKDNQINELSSQGNELSSKIGGLESAMTELNKQISNTEAQLAAAEGDREFLLKELKRMQTEKAELERQFNDLSVLRTQVAKLKEELSISRRLEWIRMGIYGSASSKKGAELLMSGIKPSEPRSNFNLNVELRQDGDAKIVSPTNAPSAGGN